MNTLNKLFVLAALLFAIAAPSYATVNISGTGPFSYSANDAYVLTGDVTCSTGTAASGCVSISGATSIYGGVDIDLHGHHISTTTNGGYGLRIDGCVANIYIHDSVGGGYISGASGGFNAVHIKDSATMSGGWIFVTGIVAYGSLTLESSNKAMYPVGNGGVWGQYNYIYGGGWYVYRVDYASFSHEWIDERYNGGDLVSTGFGITQSDYVDIEANTVIGGAGSFAARTGYSGGNLDDAVIFDCGSSGASCHGGTVKNNAFYYVADCGIEYVGNWDNQTITYNTIYQSSRAGVCGYNSYVASLDNVEFAYNAFTALPSAASNVFLFSSTPSSSMYFTNVNVHDNTLSGTIGGSQFGANSTDYMGGYSITLTNNQLGSDVYLASSGSVTDGGSNSCTTSHSASLTCH